MQDIIIIIIMLISMHIGQWPLSIYFNYENMYVQSEVSNIMTISNEKYAYLTYSIGRCTKFRKCTIESYQHFLSASKEMKVQYNFQLQNFLYIRMHIQKSNHIAVFT